MKYKLIQLGHRTIKMQSHSIWPISTEFELSWCLSWNWTCLKEMMEDLCLQLQSEGSRCLGSVCACYLHHSDLLAELWTQTILGNSFLDLGLQIAGKADRMFARKSKALWVLTAAWFISRTEFRTANCCPADKFHTKWLYKAPKFIC